MRVKTQHSLVAGCPLHYDGVERGADIPGSVLVAIDCAPSDPVRPREMLVEAETPTMIGAYGAWAAKLVADPPELSFRRPEFSRADLESWRATARGKAEALIASPPWEAQVSARVRDSYELDGLEVEELEWSLPYGPPTGALFLKPAGARERLPAVLGLHDHGGFKYFGWRKIAHAKGALHPLLVEQRAALYGGRSWANELARRGFAVLVHDVFPFGSRRIREGDVDPAIRRNPAGGEPRSISEIIEYNRWTSDYESIVAKSLFSAGTTWPGLYLLEDRAALDYLEGREEVDAGRMGCCGLSGGGMRTAYLSGIDPRIKAAVCVGFMTTWRDFLLHKSHAHTWMAYTPLLPRSLDFPELAGLRAPGALFVQNNNEDPLFTLEEMRRAAAILEEIYAKAGAPERFRAGFYAGPHKFDAAMQEEAFSWLENEL